MTTQNTYKIKGMHCASCAHVIEKTFKKTDGVDLVEVNYATETAKISFDQSKINIENLSKKIEPLGYSVVVPLLSKAHDMKNMSAGEMGMSESDHAEHLGLNQSKLEKLSEIKDMKNKVMSAIPLAIVSVFIMSWDILAQFKYVSDMPIIWGEFFHHLLPIMATYVLFVVGKPYLQGFYRFLRTGYANMDTLIGLGTSVAFLYSFILTAFSETLLKSFPNVSATYYDVTIIVIVFIHEFHYFFGFFCSDF